MRGTREMLKTLQIEELLFVAGGCGEQTCQEATLEFLQICTMPEMVEINKVFKQILLSDAMINADSDAKKAALIAAIQNITL